MPNFLQYFEPVNDQKMRCKQCGAHTKYISSHLHSSNLRIDILGTLRADSQVQNFSKLSTSSAENNLPIIPSLDRQASAACVNHILPFDHSKNWRAAWASSLQFLRDLLFDVRHRLFFRRQNWQFRKQDLKDLEQAIHQFSYPQNKHFRDLNRYII